MGVFELEQFCAQGVSVVVGERPPDLNPEYGIANGKGGYFHSSGFDGPEPDGGAWRAHPRNFNISAVVNVPATGFINVKLVKLLLSEPKGPNRGVFSVVVPFRAQYSKGPIQVALPPYI